MTSGFKDGPETSSRQEIPAGFSQAVALYGQGDIAGARGILRQILEAAPEHHDAWHFLGIVAAQAGEFEEAAQAIGKALEIAPDNADAHYNRGFAFDGLDDRVSAVACYDQAIRLRPDNAEAHYNRGSALLALNRFEDAVAAFDRTIALAPHHVAAHNNRGNALRALGRLDAALACYDTAIRLAPDLGRAWSNRGMVLCELRRYSEAIESFDRATDSGLTEAFLPGIRLHTMMRICDWRGYEESVADIARRLERGEACTTSFAAANFIDSARLLRRAAEIWTRTKYPPDSGAGEISRTMGRRKVRVGYFSMDFREHPLGYLIAGLIARHDRAVFDIYGFSYGPDTQDALRRCLQARFDQFVDVAHKSDRQVVALARAMEIDIAVDLTGYTGEARSGIFALRAAPIQVNFLGYPGTMNGDYFDYMIADRTVISPALRGHIAEKVAYLPNSYQANDDERPIANMIFDRAALGLPEDAPVFCCFNGSHKITPKMFDVWMRILRRTPGSVLWLLEDNALAAENLREEAEARGVGPDRLVFARRMPNAEHLARQRAADLFLDTLPYNAHTTASDALWAGVPLITCIGECFAGRVAASLLRSVGLPDLVAPDLGAYEELAVALARSPARLAQARRALARSRRATPLFDTALFARHIERAFLYMMERTRAGLPPEDFAVDP